MVNSAMKEKEEDGMRVTVDGQKLVKARFLTGKSMAELAKDSGVSALAINRWEKGGRVRQVPPFKRLCDVLGLDVSDVIKIDEDVS